MKKKKWVIVVIAIALAVLQHAHTTKKEQQPAPTHASAPEAATGIETNDLLLPFTCLLTS